MSMPSNEDAKRLLESIAPSKLMIFDIDGVINECIDLIDKYNFKPEIECEN